MRNRAGWVYCGLAAFASIPLIASSFQWALPGYSFSFPRDYFARPEFETEWWYYTGNLKASDGHIFGFELTFFRSANPEANREKDVSPVWRADQVYLAHFALSDISGKQFYHTERMNRAGPGLAGANLDQRRYWNGNWQVKWLSLETGRQQLEAVTDRVHLKLDLKPEKPLVVNGQNGVSQKGPLRGEASHYFSFPRIDAHGRLVWDGKPYDVTGLAWMDREFFSNVSGQAPLSWDWLYVQLDNNQELMLYRLRGKDGAVTRFSSGTFVDAQGRSRFLSQSQFTMQPVSSWLSPHSQRCYPLEWNIHVPSLDLMLHVETRLNDQEMTSQDKVTPDYWEGAVQFRGTEAARPIGGEGYLELTGYSGANTRAGERGSPVPAQ